MKLKLMMAIAILAASFAWSQTGASQVSYRHLNTGTKTTVQAALDGTLYYGTTAAGTALPSTCTDGERWLVTGSGFTGGNPRQGTYVCMNNTWGRVAGTGGGGNTLGGQGSEYFFQGNNWIYTAQNASSPSIFYKPFVGSLDSVVTFALISSNPSSGSDNQSFAIETNAASTRHTNIEVFGQGLDLGADSLRIGEYSQSFNRAVPNLNDVQLCFGNVGSTGQYCPYIFDKNGNMTRTYSTSTPGTPGTGSIVDYADNTNKTPLVKNDAGTVFAHTQQGTPASAAAACTPPQVQYDTGFAYFCTGANAWKRVAIATW